MTGRALILVPLLAAALAGCQDPYQQDLQPSDRAPAPPTRGRGDEVPPPARADDSAPAIPAKAQATPRAAASAFCSQWANWSWRTIDRQQRRLAALATGPLAQQLAAEARLRAQDRALRRDRLGVRGRVVAIDIKTGEPTRAAVCVTREERLANGRGDPEGARHRVYLATVEHTPNGWAVSAWEPQP